MSRIFERSHRDLTNELSPTALPHRKQSTAQQTSTSRRPKRRLGSGVAARYLVSLNLEFRVNTISRMRWLLSLSQRSSPFHSRARRRHLRNFKAPNDAFI